MTVGRQFKVVQEVVVMANKEIWTSMISGNQGNGTIFSLKEQDYKSPYLRAAEINYC